MPPIQIEHEKFTITVKPGEKKSSIILGRATAYIFHVSCDKYDSGGSVIVNKSVPKEVLGTPANLLLPENGARLVAILRKGEDIQLGAPVGPIAIRHIPYITEE